MEHDLKFDQHAGFFPFSLPEEMDWKDNEDEGEFRKRTGYTKVIWQDKALEGDQGAEAFEQENKSSDLPRFMVSVSDADGGQNIFVSDAASLFALRLKLLDMAVKINALHTLTEIKWVVEQFFESTHGHPWDAVRKEVPKRANGKQSR